MLDALKTQLNHIFTRRYEASRLAAERRAAELGITGRDLEVYLLGFHRGWGRGALDVSEVQSENLSVPEKIRKPRHH